MGIQRLLQSALGVAQKEEPVERWTAESVFRAHGRDVLRIVRRLVGPSASEADVDDLVQQVFVAVHRDLSRFRGDSALTTWLYGIASRTVLMHFRSGRRRARAMEALSLATPYLSRAPRDPSELYERDEELRQVWRALESMSPKKRVVFILAEIEGLSGREIAQALDVKEATVWSRLYHARQELAERLNKEGAA